MPDADRIVEKYLGGGGARPSGARGLRNCNPGNIRKSGATWQGAIGDDGDFVVFASAFFGLRALGKLLVTYQDKYGLCTVRTIISRWAPPGENNTDAYVGAVCRSTGFGADDWLRLSEPTVLAAMVKAIVRHENGSVPYTDNEIDAAVGSALSS